jgi:hypothetical protein
MLDLKIESFDAMMLELILLALSAEASKVEKKVKAHLFK